MLDEMMLCVGADCARWELLVHGLGVYDLLQVVASPRRAETSLNNAGPGQTWIRREISIMKLIKHPYIVQVMGCNAKIFIVLEFVTGGELFEKVVTCLLMILILWSCIKKFRLQSIFILLGSLWALRLITRILDPNPTTVSMFCTFVIVVLICCSSAFGLR
ncbi:hypothetical protein MKW98_011888 [Papaver atlanticum]|uniref:Protein kinase domain-containing protein n=1 Tax=Papaver atlanticum TaxID=357466 RepID=A0AAD4T5G7_9MAGN|nr:hypothetical protein MKW98_011888 [Papaver atlanticum]